MEKEATPVSSALSELSQWLSEPDSPKETKNRQKLLRNLRVRVFQGDCKSDLGFSFIGA